MMIGNRPMYAAQLKLGKPYVWLAIEVPAYLRLEMGWHAFELGFIVPKSMPNEHEMMTAKNYHGFIWRFAFWFPIDKV